MMSLHKESTFVDIQMLNNFHSTCLLDYNWPYDWIYSM